MSAIPRYGSMSSSSSRFRPLQRQRTIEDFRYISADFSSLRSENDFFDITRSRVRKIFEEFDRDADNYMSTEEYRDALRTMGVETSDSDFESILADIKTSIEGKAKISLEAFSEAVQRQRLLALFNREDCQGGEGDCVISYCDYSSDRIKPPSVVISQERWFLQDPPMWSTVRWINIDRMDPLTLKRLGIKYRLHPLAIEDALEDSARQRVKIDRYPDECSDCDDSDSNSDSGRGNGGDSGNDDKDQDAKWEHRRGRRERQRQRHQRRRSARAHEHTGFIQLVVPLLYHRPLDTMPPPDSSHSHGGGFDSSSSDSDAEVAGHGMVRRERAHGTVKVKVTSTGMNGHVSSDMSERDSLSSSSSSELKIDVESGVAASASASALASASASASAYVASTRKVELAEPWLGRTHDNRQDLGRSHSRGLHSGRWGAGDRVCGQMLQMLRLLLSSVCYCLPCLCCFVGAGAGGRQSRQVQSRERRRKLRRAKRAERNALLKGLRSGVGLEPPPLSFEDAVEHGQLESHVQRLSIFLIYGPIRDLNLKANDGQGLHRGSSLGSGNDTGSRDRHSRGSSRSSSAGTAGRSGSRPGSNPRSKQRQSEQQMTVITVQEQPGEAWTAMDARLRRNYSRLRQGSGEMLVYALLDCVVDQLFPILDYLEDRLVMWEEELHPGHAHASDVTPGAAYQIQVRFDVRKVYGMKKQLRSLTRKLKPMKEVVAQIIASRDLFLGDATVYMRDVYDHLNMALEELEEGAELCRSLMDDHSSQQANRMNQVMYVLTLVTTVFVPGQFFTGVYGMNFDYMPELHYKYGYAIFWTVMSLMVVCLFMYFKCYLKWL